MLTIGKISLKSPFVLAPISGYTDSPFRKIAVKHGAGFTMTELVSAEGIVRNIRNVVSLMDFTDEERPIGIQIFGNNAEVIAEAAVIAETLNPDFIDINMGCPARNVVGSGSGSALIVDPLKAESVADAVVRRVKLPVSVKMRIGWDDSSKNYIEVSKRLEGTGISFLIVHGRTRSQFYSGKADWNAITQICSELKIPVIGNGDIKSNKEAELRLSESGCSAVMIGRGALGNPWIFSGIEHDLSMMKTQIKDHYNLMLDYYGNRGIILMRKHSVKYIHNFRNSSRARSMMVRSENLNEIYGALELLEDI
jgi:nifR3 family TIM-barrel protein